MHCSIFSPARIQTRTPLLGTKNNAVFSMHRPRAMKPFRPRAGAENLNGGSASQEADDGKKSAKYSEEMQAKMGTSLVYRHELGMDYNRIMPDLIVGSCLQTADDVDHLADNENVKVVFCLQEDSDMEYFNLDIKPIQDRCKERGDIQHVRFSIKDFDPFDLRKRLPKAVTRLAKEHDPNTGTVYIHCTAGMGRAPATAVAYMNWIRGIPVDTAYDQLTSKRRCSPKIEAIRSATSDLLLGVGPVMTTIALHRFGTATSVQVAGLDVGWNNPLDLSWDNETHRYVLKRAMFPGTYQFKFIIDGHWTYSADHPTMIDGNNINNCLEVTTDLDPVTKEKLTRFMSKGAVLTSEEQEELKNMLCPWGTHDLLPKSNTVEL